LALSVSVMSWLFTLGSMAFPTVGTVMVPMVTPCGYVQAYGSHKRDGRT